MFVFGLIVGIILGVIATYFWFTRWAINLIGVSYDEAAELGMLLIEAGQNRECEVMLVKNDEAINVVLLEED